MTQTFRLLVMKSDFVIAIPLYGCETWTLLADSEKRIQFFDTKRLRNFFASPTGMWSKISSLVGPPEPLLATVKRRKLAWFGHVTRHNSLSKTILQGTFEDGRRCGRLKNYWMDNIKEWTSLPMPELPTRASCRRDWKRISAESSLMSPDDPVGQGLNCFALI